MDILLTGHGPQTEGWQPLTLMEAAYRRGDEMRLAMS